jgi:hypothetical protein
MSGKFWAKAGAAAEIGDCCEESPTVGTYCPRAHIVAEDEQPSGENMRAFKVPSVVSGLLLAQAIHPRTGNTVAKIPKINYRNSKDGKQTIV